MCSVSWAEEELQDFELTRVRMSLADRQEENLPPAQTMNRGDLFFLPSEEQNSFVWLIFLSPEH